MTARTISSGIIRAIAILTALWLLGQFFIAIRLVLIYLALAIVISLISRPLVIFLKKYLKFSNILATLASMLLMLIAMFGLVASFVPLVLEQGKNLSLLDVEALKNNLQTLYFEVASFLSQYNINLSKTFWDNQWVSSLDLEIVSDLVNRLGVLLGNLTMGVFSVIFISFFLIKDSKILENALFVLLPDSKEARVKKSLNTIKNLLSRYFVGLLTQFLILFIFYSILLSIFGVHNALVIAFLCALLNLVPYLGPIAGGILMILLTMTSFLGQDFSSVIIPKTIYIAIGFMVGQLIDNFFTQPLIFSKSVRSHPLEIFLVIIIFGLIGGPIGMIVAIPTYTALKVILKEFLANNKIVVALTKNL